MDITDTNILTKHQLAIIADILKNEKKIHYSFGVNSYEERKRVVTTALLLYLELLEDSAEFERGDYL